MGRLGLFIANRVILVLDFIPPSLCCPELHPLNNSTDSITQSTPFPPSPWPPGQRFKSRVLGTRVGVLGCPL
jgi:hypothetical protein